MIKALSKTILLLGGVGLLAAGCISMNHGRMAKLVNEKEAEFYVNYNDVKPGDKFAVFKDECNSPTKNKQQRCWTDKVGDASVVKAYDNKVLVKAEGNLRFENGLKADRAYLVAD